MRLKWFAFALVSAGLAAASVAIAAPPAGKGKPPTTGAGCKPSIMVVLKGTLTAAPGGSATSISVNVTHANHQGLAFGKAAQPLNILVDAKTVVRRQGKKTLGDLASGDRVLVQARVCKTDLANNASPQLTAIRIIAHPAKTQGDTQKDEKDEKD